MLKSKKTRKLLSVFLIFCILSVFFASCGAKAMSNDSKYVEDLYYDSYNSGIDADYGYSSGNAKPGYAAEDGTYVKDVTGSNANNPLEGRKIIKTVNITAETKEFDMAVSAIEQKIETLGGYIQNSNATGTSLNSDRIYNRKVNYTIRIPAEKLNEFLSSVSELVNISSNNSNVDDITETYVDIEARLKTLRTEETRLLELLEKAAGLSDIITLENRLSDVTYQIESYTARLRSYDTLISFSSVILSLNEVVDYTEPSVQNPSFGERISKAFKESWRDFADGWRDFTVEFVYLLPTLLILALVVIAIIVIVRVCIKRNKRKTEKKPEIENNPKA